MTQRTCPGVVDTSTTGENPPLVAVHFTLPAARITEELNRLGGQSKLPPTVVCDNEAQFYQARASIRGATYSDL